MKRLMIVITVIPILKVEITKKNYRRPKIITLLLTFMIIKTTVIIEIIKILIRANNDSNINNSNEKLKG